MNEFVIAVDVTVFVEGYWCWAEGQLVAVHEQQLWSKLWDAEVDSERRLAHWLVRFKAHSRW